MRTVIHFSGARGYPQRPPFAPPEHYPELAAFPPEIDPGNRVYAGVRELCARSATTARASAAPTGRRSRIWWRAAAAS